MEQIEAFIDSAHLDQVKALYQQLSDSMSLAGDNDDHVASAVDEFKVGLLFAEKVRNEARAAAGL